MTEETQTPSADQEVKSEAAVRAHEVGKKLTGFLGGLAEKAKNIDVKELAEKAKNIDVKELTEKAKQKVNEVKDKATEINAGKTDNFAQPREEVPADQMKELMTKLSDQLVEEVPAIIESGLIDAAPGEQIIAKIKFGAASDTSYIALSAKALYHFVKASDQFCIYVYPLSSVRGFSILPPRGETAGRMVVFTKTEEVKLTLSSLETYGKALLLYRKLREHGAK